MIKYFNYYLTVSLLLVVVGLSGCSAGQYRIDSQKSVEYHIDSQKSFDALSSGVFQPGDSILFKRGKQFNGMFAPGGKGTEQAPIKIDVYGYGKRPVIDAHGKHIAGLLLKNPSYWEIKGLEITNTDGTDEDQGNL